MERTGIIGTGLIGGSLALALKRQGLGGEVLGYDADPASLERALKMGAVDAACASAAELAARCGLVVVAVPVGVIPRVLAEIAAHLEAGALVIDVGSTKERIVRAAAESLPAGAVFVGGHPMAGSERQGIDNATPDLFVNAAFIFTPTPDCAAETQAFLSQTFTAIGARVIFMDPRVHDRAVSMVSHLPHVLAFALMNAAGEEGREVRGMGHIISGGFRDMTRIASSDPSLWAGILLENRAEVGRALGLFGRYLEELRKALAAEDAAALEEAIERARSSRLEMMPALRTVLQELYTLSIPVDNRPGIVSEITLAMGEKGINIEDLEIAHPLEGEVGLLKVYVRGAEAAESAREVLAGRGFRLNLEKSVRGA